MSEAAINDLRRTTTAHERELGGLGSKVGDLKEDVDELGSETRKTRNELSKQIAACEARINARFDRMVTTGRWVIGLCVPAVCTLLGILIGKT